MRPPNKGMKQTKPAQAMELRSLSPVLGGPTEDELERIVTSGLAVVALAVTLVPWALSAGSPEEVEVAVFVGGARVPLSVHVRFADVRGKLPKPGELAEEDAHARGHGARTYCYAYQTARGMSVLEFHDSDFGLHTARLARAGKTTYAKCTRLKAEPRIVVGTARFGLESPVAMPAGFQKTIGPNVVTFERSWTYQDISPRTKASTCFYRAVSISVTSEAGARQSITVQNWKEPGC